jgi:biotin carboxyl carrier protein
MTRLFVEAGDRRFEISLAPLSGGRYAARIDGREVVADYVETAPHEVSLIVDGRAFMFWFRDDHGTYRVTDRVGDFEVRLKDERARVEDAIFSHKPRGNAEHEVRALMPGIVTRVLVEKGQAVAAGAPLLIIEAMKMENEVRADVAGTVRSVGVSPGSTVNAGDLLVSIGPPEPASQGT